MQEHELVPFQGQLRVGTPVLVGKLDLILVRGKRRDDGPDLASDETVLGNIDGERDDIKVDAASTWDRPRSEHETSCQL